MSEALVTRFFAVTNEHDGAAVEEQLWGSFAFNSERIVHVEMHQERP